MIQPVGADEVDPGRRTGEETNRRLAAGVYSIFGHAPVAHPVAHENPTPATDCADFTDLESV